MLEDIVGEGAAALAYGAVGIALMALGYLVVDLITPGKLGQLIWTERNRGAGLLLATKLAGVGAIITTAILASEEGLGEGLVSTGVYGLLGILLMAVAFFALDVLTPGKLGEMVVEADAAAGSQAGIHPACWVAASADLVAAAIVAAAIS
ncbi:MAG: DUF350 domain-containing protein [Actinomadura sp.]